MKNKFFRGAETGKSRSKYGDRKRKPRIGDIKGRELISGILFTCFMLFLASDLLMPTEKLSSITKAAAEVNDENKDIG